METLKGIYHKLVELFYESTTGKIISLIDDLYKLKASKDEGISTCLTKASQIRNQLQDLGEMISDQGMITIVLNTLTDEQGNVVSEAYEEVKDIPFNNLWLL